MRIIAVLLCTLCLLASGCKDTRPDRARAKVIDLADYLHAQYDTATGLYIHAKELTTEDPWGNTITVTYRTKNNSEVVEVRSPGPDGIAHNRDDLVAVRKRYRVGAGSTDIHHILRDGTSGAVEGLKGRGGKKDLPKQEEKK